MTRTDLRVLLEIPDYWTPEQALAGQHQRAGGGGLGARGGDRT